MIDVTKETGREAYRAQLEKELIELVDPETGIVSLKYAQYINCPLCDTNEPETLFIVKGYPHVRCKQCSMVYVNPQVKQERLKALYSKQSKANDMWIDVLLSEAEKNTNFALYDEYIATLENLTKHRFLVDLGCGIGDFMLQAERRGWKTEGVDLSQKAVTYAQQERNLNVRLSRLEDAGYAASSIPVLIATGVLEHLNNPREFMRMARYYLRPEGLILFQVPNIHSLANMILQEKSTSFDGRNHLLVFSVDTLSKLCTQEEFTVETYRTDIVPSHALCKLFQYSDPYNSTLTLENLPPLLRPFFEDKEKHDKVVGLLENLGMGQRIMMVVRRS